MPEDTTTRPNILIIYPDQLRADAMSCAGNPCIKTPHFDRLASEGVRFTDAFVCFPLCGPFRASLFTGKYPHANGMFANHYPIPTDQKFLAQILRDNGYQTGYVGKWHLDGGVKFGFVPPGERRLGFDTFHRLQSRPRLLRLHFLSQYRSAAHIQAIRTRFPDRPSGRIHGDGTG